MAKTIAIALTITLLSVAPLTAFAQPLKFLYLVPSSYAWFASVIISSGSIIVLLIAANSLQKPTSFASLPVYLFFDLTIFVVFFILSISFFPTDVFGYNFPISTGNFIDLQNKTQWSLNIGGVPNIRNSSGLQIPIYVIIGGILGAYIRYLYIGISEFKESFQLKLNSFEESFHDLLKELDSYNAFTGEKISPWPIVNTLVGYFPTKRRYAINFELEVTRLNDPPPEDKINSSYEITNIDDSSLPPDVKRMVDYTSKRRLLWSKIRNAETNFRKHRFRVSLEIITHILKTVGSFFLGPLLAVLAWLLLSIGGTNNVWTFALVSFAIGLTTKTIINRVMNFVGEKITDGKSSESTTTLDTTLETQAAAPAYYPPPSNYTQNPRGNGMPSIYIDPKQAVAGQLLIVRGTGFHPNSHIYLEYSGSKYTGKYMFRSSSTGIFGYEMWLPSSIPTGVYVLTAKDELGNSVEEAFTV